MMQYLLKYLTYVTIWQKNLKELLHLILGLLVFEKKEIIKIFNTSGLARLHSCLLYTSRCV